MLFKAEFGWRAVEVGGVCVWRRPAFTVFGCDGKPDSRELVLSAFIGRHHRIGDSAAVTLEVVRPIPVRFSWTVDYRPRFNEPARYDLALQLFRAVGDCQRPTDILLAQEVLRVRRSEVVLAIAKARRSADPSAELERLLEPYFLPA